MKSDQWKWISGVLAGLLVVCVIAGMWLGRLPTKDQVDELIEQVTTLNEQSLQLNFLLQAHGITVEALYERRYRAEGEVSVGSGAGDDPGSD